VHRVPGTYAREDSSGSRPETGEVVDVKEVETAVERSEKDDEEDADEDRDKVRKVGSGPGAHEVKKMLMAS
jgi:hypothetical protein